MNDHAIDLLLEETEVPSAAIRPLRPNVPEGAAIAGVLASATTLAERTAGAWVLLQQLQGHPFPAGGDHPGADHVDEITVDWLARVAAPEDWSWLAENFHYRTLGWPTVSLLESLLGARSSDAQYMAMLAVAQTGRAGRPDRSPCQKDRLVCPRSRDPLTPFR
jgi:hypothetical protein